MQAIVDAGLTDYYRFRTEPAVAGVLPDALETQLDELRVFDEPEFIDQLLTAEPSQHSAEPAGSVAEVVLSIDGISCGACVWLLERRLYALAGVLKVSVNGSTHRAHLRFNPQVVSLSAILQHIKRIGYPALPLDVKQQEQRLRQESRQQIQRLFVSGIAMMQVMMYALPGYLSDRAEIAQAHLQLLHWASMVLTVPVILFAAKPFYQGAWRSFRTGSVGMDVPVVIGITAAFCISVYHTVTHQGQIYFDSVSMFVFLLLLARYLEWSVRSRSLRTIDEISQQTIDTANLCVDGATRVVPAGRLKVGDTVLVNSGETVPVNGIVLDNRSLIDLSVLTGESAPLAVEPQDVVAGGAIVVGTPLLLRATATQQQSTLSVIAGLIQRAASDKPAMVKSADQVAHYFVWWLLSFAAVVFLCWWWIDSARAATVAITVLVVSCPCALSLATPAALAVATGNLLRSRLLITKSHVLETSAAITDVVLDKTGTLTNGTPQVISVDCADQVTSADAVALAKVLEAGAAHPFAVAISELDMPDALPTALLQQIQHQVGAGVQAQTADGRYFRIGSPQWCQLDQIALERFDNACSPGAVGSFIYLCVSSEAQFTSPRVIARFVFADTLRPEAADVIACLKSRGLRVHLLSGDQRNVSETCARTLGIDHVCARALPQDKQRYVNTLQQQGACVLMVGDGINDAPVLALADVSVAMSHATSLAQTSADAIALAGGLNALPLLLQQARRTSRVVKQNLAWALGYNALAIPLAALGLVAPWAAAIGMAGSSLLVAANACRLWRVEQPVAKFTPYGPWGVPVWNH